VIQEHVQFLVYAVRNVSVSEFVAYWAPRYKYKNEHHYAGNINEPLTAARIQVLFEWKNGSRLSAPKQRSVETNYIARIADLHDFPRSASARDFLQAFPSGGAIWRIFLLHCWQPKRFPIYDHHVHGAMVSIQEQKIEEIQSQDRGKIGSYLERYLPFYGLFTGVDQREADRALWFYGKTLKAIRI
jgi:hypothetical protein